MCDESWGGGFKVRCVRVCVCVGGGCNKSWVGGSEVVGGGEM